MQVLQYVITYQVVMTHIDVGDDNSAPEQSMVRADKGWSRTLTGLLSLADFAADAVRSFRVPVAVWTIPSPSPGDPELTCCPSSGALLRHLHSLLVAREPESVY